MAKGLEAGVDLRAAPAPSRLQHLLGVDHRWHLWRFVSLSRPQKPASASEDPTKVDKCNLSIHMAVAQKAGTKMEPR